MVFNVLEKGEPMTDEKEIKTPNLWKEPATLNGAWPKGTWFQQQLKKLRIQKAEENENSYLTPSEF